MQLGGTCRALCIELYIRGITTQMNDLAHAKSQQLLMSIKDVEFRLSTSLMELADLLRQDVSVWRECILTAFSLNPTRECFGQVESAAVESYKRLQAPTSMEVRFSRVTVTDVYATAGRCGSVDVLLDPRSVLDAGALGLSPALCDDLAVILRCLRYQALQWSLEWGELKRRCIRYMEDIKERINSPSELRFLKIDFDNLRNSSCEDVRNFFGINGTSPQWNENADESCVQMIERSYKQVYPDEKMEIVFQEVKRTSTSRLSSPMSEVTTHTAVGVHVSQSQSLLVRAQRDPVDETTREGSSEDEWQDTKNKKGHAHEKKHRGARGSNKKSCVKIDRSVKRKDDVNLNSIIENIPNGVEADQELQSAMEYFDLECPPMDEIATLPHTFPADATETSLKKDLEKSLPIFHNTQMESNTGNEVIEEA
ncbi:Uncharacterized protein GBIM_14353 [Gryllus bimaculatus]|nr:Uncharacterized protein GBIM_14353 [Gryllus bimaculatus]